MSIDPRFFKMLWKVLILFAFVPVLPLAIQTHPYIAIPFGVGFAAYMAYLIITMHRWVQERLGEPVYEEEDVGVDCTTHGEPSNLPDPNHWYPEEDSEEFEDDLWSMENWNDDSKQD